MMFLGLDGEMSDSELRLGAKLIQIGTWHPEAGAFCSDLGWAATTYQPTDAPDSAYCTDRALGVNGFTLERIATGPPASEVDDALHAWMVAAGAPTDHRGTAPIGFNVNAFDMPFVAAHLPRTSSLLSRRAVDLNAVVLTMAGNVAYNGGYPTASGWKRLGKRAGRALCAQHQVPGADHDAGYDAALAYGAWDFYRAAMRGQAPYLD